MESMKEIERETIKRARQANLAEYLIQNGEPLEQDGNRYRHKEHDSLVFTDNAYYWNSRDESGNAIDYLMRYKGMDFMTALYELTNTIPEQGNIEQDTPEKFLFANLNIEYDMRRTVAYLNKSRGIKYSLIEWLIKNKLLFQEAESNNIIFPMYDEKKEIVGAELCGTLTDKRFKGIKTGSKYGYGYNLNPNQNQIVNFILFFESAVDLLSFWDIKQSENKSLKNCLLVSMGGLKENIIKQMLSLNQSAQPFLCVDNDEAGAEFIKVVKPQIEGVKPFLPNAPYKDWNDQLRANKKP